MSTQVKHLDTFIAFITIIWLSTNALSQLELKSIVIAQTDNSELSFNLTGSWERQSSPRNPLGDIYISHTGSEVTANAIPFADCNFYGINVTYPLEFQATIEGNVITGEINICSPRINNIELTQMDLTVVDQGNTLRGSWFDPNDNTTVPTSYIRTGAPSPISITVATDKQEYQPNDVITISGRVEGISTTEKEQVFVEVYAPDDTQYTYTWIPIDDQGSYSYPFHIPEPSNGTYTARSTFGGVSDEAIFSFGKQIESLPILVTSVTATAAAAAVGGVYAIKKGYIKFKKPLFDDKHSDTTLTTIDIRFECGIMNYKVSNDSKTSLTGDISEIEEKFANTLDAILEKRKKINKIREIKEFSTWCKEAKEDPNKIISKISEHTVNEFLKCIRPYFINLLLKEIYIESDINVIPGKDQPRQLRTNINFKLQPLEPYIGIAFYVNNIKTSSTKLVFYLDTTVKTKSMILKRAKISSTSDQIDTKITNNSVEGKRIDIQDLVVTFKMSLAKLFVGPLEKLIEPPIELAKREFEVKNISFLH